MRVTFYSVTVAGTCTITHACTCRGRYGMLMNGTPRLASTAPLGLWVKRRVLARSEACAGADLPSWVSVRIGRPAGCA